MERDEFDRDPLERDDFYREAAVERAIAHVHREMFEPPSLSSLAPDLPLGLPDPSDERLSHRRLDEDAYFARENTIGLREMAEIARLRDKVPEICGTEWTTGAMLLRRQFCMLLVDAHLAQVQHRPALTNIRPWSGPEGCFGYFNPYDFEIGLDWRLFKLPDPRPIMIVYFHESRHAYQFHAIRNPDAHPEIHASTIATWTQARNQYTLLTPDATDAEIAAYENNALEIDACSYAERQMSRLYERRVIYL